MGDQMFNLDRIVGDLVNQDIEHTYSEHTRRTGGSNTPVVRRSTKKYIPPEDPEQHAKILVSYSEIPRHAWSTIPLKTYVRYMTNDKELKTGARLKEIFKEPNGHFTFTFRKFSRGRTLVWTSSSKDMLAIYKLRDDKQYKKKIKNNLTDRVTGGRSTVPSNTHDELQLSNRNTEHQSDSSQNMSALGRLGDKLLFDDSSTVINRLEMIESKVQKIEQDLKRLFLLVKRMYEETH
jgi:hypothetical protein